MNIIEIIQKRKSCRTYNPVPLHRADQKILEDYIREIQGLPGEELPELCIIGEKADDKKMKLNYGMIRGHNTYLLGTVKSSAGSRVNYGYLVEKVVLKATETGISTCWIGYFDPAYFKELICKTDFEIPGLVILGYSKEKETNSDKLQRMAINASKRQGWEKLFFNYTSAAPLNPDAVPGYSDSLEMVRLAPSSGNTQPWRVFFDDLKNEFHFFKKPVNERYESKGLHDIDLGIALSHFELASLYNNLSGSWIKYPDENITPIRDLQYIRTWKCT